MRLFVFEQSHSLSADAWVPAGRNEVTDRPHTGRKHGDKQCVGTVSARTVRSAVGQVSKYRQTQPDYSETMNQAEPVMV